VEEKNRGDGAEKDLFREAEDVGEEAERGWLWKLSGLLIFFHLILGT
jgi:hypothetical protein